MFENGFVLLAHKEFNTQQFIHQLQADWKLIASEIKVKDNILSFSVNGFYCTLSVMPARIPNNEAEHYAKATYFCPDALDIAESHQAHLLITLVNLEGGNLSVDLMTTYSKIIASCLQQEVAIGVYTSHSLFSAEFYINKCLQYFPNNEIPIMLWVYIGFARNQQGTYIYTIGMEKFQKHEMEILNSQEDMVNLMLMLSGMCNHIVKNNLVMNDGETFGFSEEQKWAISLSKSVYSPVETSLKLQVQDIESIYREDSNTRPLFNQGHNQQELKTKAASHPLLNPYLTIPLIPLITVLVFFLSLKGDHSFSNVLFTIKMYFFIAHMLIVLSIRNNNWKNLLMGLYIPFVPLWFAKNSLLEMKKTQNIWSNIDVLILLTVLFIHTLAFLGLIGFAVFLQEYSLPILLTWLVSAVFSCGFILYKMSENGLAWLLFGVFVPVISQLIFYNKHKEVPNARKSLILYFTGIVTFVISHFIYQSTLLI